MERPSLTRGLARVRLAEAFVEESTRLRDAPRPAWCGLLSANDVENYARQALGALRKVSTCDGHSMHTYETADDLAINVADYLAAGLRAGEGALLVVRPKNWALISARLATLGFDAHHLEDQGQIVTFDCRVTLNSILRDGVALDHGRFTEVIGGAIAAARTRHPRLRLFGEMVNDLWEAGQVELALELEQLWNAFLAGQHLRLHCAYSAPTSDVGRTAMSKIEQQHTEYAAA